MIQRVGRRIITPLKPSHPERSAAAGEGGGGAESKDPVESQVQLPPSATGAYWIYILSNDRLTTLYIGITHGLSERPAQHHSGDHQGFTRRYNLGRLIYYENFVDPLAAIAREKQLKGWTRAKKVALITRMNPTFLDLAPVLFGEEWERGLEMQVAFEKRRGPSTPHSSPPPAPVLRRSAQDDL